VNNRFAFSCSKVGTVFSPRWPGIGGGGEGSFRLIISDRRGSNQVETANPVIFGRPDAPLHASTDVHGEKAGATEE